LLSTSAAYKTGLGNQHGLVGRFFMEHPNTTLRARVPAKTYPYRIGFFTAESLQFTDPENRSRNGAFKLEFLSSGPSPAQLAAGGGKWGAALKKEIQETFGHQIAIMALVEQPPSSDNYIALDSSRLDAFGDPCPLLDLSIGAHETSTGQRAHAIMRDIFRAMGAQITDSEGLRFERGAGHHMGGCRMGDDPSTSVVDRDLKVHGIDNLFIVGSSVFPTGGAVNPTLTIAALALRAGQHMARVLGR